MKDGFLKVAAATPAIRVADCPYNAEKIRDLAREAADQGVEVVVFPRDYEKNREYLEVDNKVFVRGRVSEEDEKASKLICEKVIPFEKMKKELWIQFPDKAAFLENEQIVYGYLADSEGEDEVVIYCAKERAIKKLPRNRNIRINQQVLSRLMNHFGESRVKVVEKAIENHF